MKKQKNVEDKFYIYPQQAPMHTFQKGITLIALIITIIVMIILVGVTVALATNGGLMGKAQEARSKQIIAEEREQLKLAINEWGAQKYYPSNTYTFKTSMEESLSGKVTIAGADNGPLTVTFTSTNNAYTVTENGTITASVSQSETENLRKLEEYILGPNGEGRNLNDITNTELDYLADPESGMLEGEVTHINTISDDFYDYEYIQYGGKIYKYRLYLYSEGEEEDYDEYFKSDGDYGIVETWQTLNTRIGKYVQYDNKTWIILYDDSTNGLQMISLDTFNTYSFRFGINDSYLTNWNGADFNNNGRLENYEKEIYSYNNAIATLNSACEELVTPSDNILSVRCAGSVPNSPNSENANFYTSTNTEILPYDGRTGVADSRVKSADENYLSDNERILVMDLDLSNEFWLASRFIEEGNEFVSFEMRTSSGTARVYYVADCMEYNGTVVNYGLRPVVRLNPNIQFTGEGTQESPYTFQ